MAAEKSLWKWIKRGGLPGVWQRIHTRKIPDAICFCDDPVSFYKGYMGRQFFVELKEIAKWKGDGTVNLTLKPSQIAFFKEWPGEKYIFAQIGKERFWFSGQSLIVKKSDAIPGPFKRSR